MHRKYHRVQKVGDQARPRHVVFVDCETYEHRREGNRAYHRLRLGWACYTRYRPERDTTSERWLSFTEPGQFWDWLHEVTPQRVTIRVFSCNLAFDFTILDGWTYLPFRGARVTFHYFGSGTTLLQVRGWRRRFWFLDTLNLLPVSVARLGEALDLPKGDVDWRDPDDEVVSAYCKRDVEIITQAVEGFSRFIKEHKFGPVAITLASQAFKTYRHRFMHHPIFIHDSDAVCRLERDGYFGGRTEAYRLGKIWRGPIWILDVNSEYPFVMRNEKYPCKLLGTGKRLSITRLERKLTRYAVVADVDVETDVPAYPYRGVRTCFPVGRFRTVLTTPELRHAMDHGHVKRVHRWADYEQADLFSGYVDAIIALRDRYRKDGNKLYSFICKRLANSLYGKWGQYGCEWIDVGYSGRHGTYSGLHHDRVTGKTSKEVCFFGWVQRQGAIWESTNSFPAIAAHVTAYGRMLLWSIMQQAGSEHVYYCDTDSVMVDKTGVKNLRKLLHNTRLGALKVETVLDWLDIYAGKDYIHSQGVKVKGIPRSAEQIAYDAYRYEIFPGFATLLREGLSGEYPVITIEKVLKRDYVKGIIGHDGRVTPLVMDAWG